MNDPIAMSVKYLVGLSFTTDVLHATSFGFVIVLDSLSHPWILIVVANAYL